MIGRLPLYVLLFGCVLFGAILVKQITRPGGDPPLPTEPAAAPDAAPAAPRMPRMRAGGEPIAAILARPLFSPTRRPPQANAANPGNASGLDDTRLTGIVIAPGKHLAIFAPTDAALLTVTEGESISGWRVDNITPREVSLSGPDGTKTLEPKFDPNLAPAAAADAQPQRSRRSRSLSPPSASGVRRSGRRPGSRSRGPDSRS